MVKNIMRDPLFLSQKSETATKEDLQIGRDLMDTLRANRERCVGMAANMIGVKMSTSYVSYTKPIFEVIKIPKILEKSSFFACVESKCVI